MASFIADLMGEYRCVRNRLERDRARLAELAETLRAYGAVADAAPCAAAAGRQTQPPSSPVPRPEAQDTPLPVKPGPGAAFLVMAEPHRAPQVYRALVLRAELGLTKEEIADRMELDPAALGRTLSRYGIDLDDVAPTRFEAAAERARATISQLRPDLPPGMQHELAERAGREAWSSEHLRRELFEIPVPAKVTRARPGQRSGSEDTRMTRLILFLTALLVATPAVAQQPPRCGDYHALIAMLEQRYAEQPVAFGIQTNGHLLQVLASEEAGTWTAITVSPRGRACIVAAGKGGWEALPDTGEEA